ncbi:MAG: hypothetical protein ACTSPI_16880 [Candidatus Heimdallarchaeaceae archaeon]
MTLSKLKLILNAKLEDHKITLDWIIKTKRPIQEKEAVENRIAVYKEILELIDD